MAGINVTYVDATTFTVIDDQTAVFMAGRRVKAYCGADGYKYGTIESASFVPAVTTVVLTATSDELTSNLTTVEVGVVSVGTDSSMPVHNHDGSEGSGMRVSYNDLLSKPNIPTDFYSKAEVDSKDATVLSTANAYTDQEVANVDVSDQLDTLSGTLQDQIDDKSDIGHTHDDRYYTDTELDAGQLDNRYYTETELDNGQLDDRYYTEGETDTLLSGKSDTSHTHDDRYYTEGEVDTLLTGKSDTGHTHDDRYYTETETDNLLDDKYDKTGGNIVGDVSIDGNLTVSGTEFIADVEEVLIEDHLLTINYGETGPGVSFPYAGIEIDRGTETDYLFIYDEDQDNFRVGISGATEAVATREDDPTDNYVPYWNATDYRFDTTSGIDVARLNEMSQAHEDMEEPHGFVDMVATLAFDDGTMTFSITGDHDIYIEGEKYSKTTDSVVITDVDGIHYIYYNTSGVLSHSTVPWTIGQEVPLAYVLWDATNNTGLVGEERHGIRMDSATHLYLHDTIGARYDEGFGIGNYTLNTDSDAALEFSFEAGEFHDEDIEHAVAAKSAPAQIPVFYRDGVAGPWRWDAATDLPFKGTTQLQYNLNTAGTWSQTNVSNQYYTAYWFIATNSEAGYEIISIQGQREDSSLSNAQANNTIDSVGFGSFPLPEIVVLYRVILQYKTTYGGTLKALIADVTDFRTSSAVGNGYVPTDHGSLTGLGDDDHSQYSLADGTRAFTGVVEGVTPTADAHLATKGYVDDFTPLTTKGDLYTYSTAPARLPVGTDDYVLTADSSEATGMKWAEAGGSGSTDFDPTPDTDHTGNGITATMTVDVNATGFGAALYVAADGNLEEADATDNTTSPCFALALETGTGSKSVLLQGFIRDDTWDWTVGGTIYLSETAGAMTQTAPETSEAMIQVLGVATHADRIYFAPNFGLAEVA